MSAINAAFGEVLPKQFFDALTETEEESAAMFNLHQNRAEWEKARAESSKMMPEVDGGI